MDDQIQRFFENKTPQSLMLFHNFVEEYKNIGPVSLRAAKTMIALINKTSFAYVIKIGKDFIDIVFPFAKPYENNLCFKKISQVPNQIQFNHHLRIYYKDDINEEVKQYMKLAYEGNN